jgi:hypothetical protein
MSTQPESLAETVRQEQASDPPRPTSEKIATALRNIRTNGGFLHRLLRHGDQGHTPTDDQSEPQYIQISILSEPDRANKDGGDLFTYMRVTGRSTNIASGFSRPETLFFNQIEKELKGGVKELLAEGEKASRKKGGKKAAPAEPEPAPAEPEPAPAEPERPKHPWATGTPLGEGTTMKSTALPVTELVTKQAGQLREYLWSQMWPDTSSQAESSGGGRYKKTKRRTKKRRSKKARTMKRRTKKRRTKKRTYRRRR